MNTIEKFIIDLSKKGVKSHYYLILQLLVQPDGSLISAKGLEYKGPDLNYVMFDFDFLEPPPHLN